MTEAVTVIIPTKDRPALLPVTLASVLGQRAVDVSVVVVDDGGSTGSCAQAAGGDPRVAVLRHAESRGVSTARNTGLAATSTPWVAFMDDDDLWAPDKLAHQLAALRADPGSRWACSAAVPFYDDGSLGRVQKPPAGSDVSILLLRANVIPGGGSGVLASTELVRDAGAFDPGLSNLADWDCWLRLAQRSRVARVHHADIGYRRHSGSMAHAVERSQRELEHLRSKYAALYDAAGVEINMQVWTSYLNVLVYESGLWRQGVRGSWRVARAHGNRRSLLQPLVYARPVLARRGRERLLARRHPARYAYARQWIDRALAPTG